jgi:polar amino acid transport system substrate-binding protein
MSARLFRAWARALRVTAGLLAAALLPALAAVATAAERSDDALAAIRARGRIVVGVKKDVQLWGYQDPRSGELTGMEVDLARSLARQLGVALELVGLRSIERIEALDSGRVDVLIATLSDSPERRAQVAMVLPHYYSSGVNLLARKSEGFRAWNELKNRRICGRRGSYYNREITVRYGADVVAFHSLDWALQAVRDGRCSALVYDDTAIVALLQRPEWAGEFEMPMTTIHRLPWALAIARQNAGSPLEKALSAAVIRWHREGTLIGVEKAWHIPTTDFLRDLNAVWNRKTPDGRWYCGTEVSDKTPADCL